MGILFPECSVIVELTVSFRACIITVLYNISKICRMKKQKNKPKKNTPLGGIPSSFDCSGSFQFKQPFNLSLISKDGHQMVLNFPHPTPEQLQNAIKHAKKSGFGKGTENVVDQSYRYAFQYLPDELGLPSALTEHIFNHVTKAISNSLGCDCSVRAELIKLNIYPKGGLFKKHVDSPKGEAFGSLVVFLPCFFTGGELIIENKSDQHSFQFGGNTNLNKIEWAAFYNDCLHQISQVKEGYRLTLSYNLFFEGDTNVSVFPKQEIVDALSQLKQGKIYGYFCEHYYGNNSLKGSEEKVNQMRLLKGKDYDLYVAAKALGAKKVELKVLYEQVLLCLPAKFQNYEKEKEERLKSKAKYNPFTYGRLEPQQYNEDRKQIMLIGSPSQIEKPILGWQEGENQYYEDQLQVLRQKLKVSIWNQYPEVEWLNEKCEHSNYTYAFCTYYGNDYSVNEKYCQLVLLIYL